MLSPMSPTTVRLAVSALLEQRHMSTAQFAEKAKLTYNQALSLRRGAYARIDLDTIGKICDALGVMPGDLFQVEITPQESEA